MPRTLCPAVALRPLQQCLSLAARVRGRIGQKRQETSTLDSARDHALMLGAGSRPAAPIDAPTGGHKVLEQTNVFVVDRAHFFGAELAHAASPHAIAAARPR